MGIPSRSSRRDALGAGSSAARHRADPTLGMKLGHPGLAGAAQRFLAVLLGSSRRRGPRSPVLSIHSPGSASRCSRPTGSEKPEPGTGRCRRRRPRRAQKSIAGASVDLPLASFGSTIARAGRGLARDREPAVGTRQAERGRGQRIAAGDRLDVALGAAGQAPVGRGRCGRGRRQRPEQPGECRAHRRPRMRAAKGRNSAVMAGRYPGALLIRLRSATTWNMSSALSVNLAQGSVREQTVAA
jgi:hypothetical protein